MNPTNKQSLSKEEGNEIIALFMGAKWKRRITDSFVGDVLEFSEGVPTWHKPYWSSATLKYHTSWDWLMPVVEKIAKLPFTAVVLQTNGHCQFSIDFNCGTHYVEIKNKSSINAAWLAVTAFIQWKNSNQSKTTTNP